MLGMKLVYGVVIVDNLMELWSEYELHNRLMHVSGIDNERNKIRAEEFKST